MTHSILITGYGLGSSAEKHHRVTKSSKEKPRLSVDNVPPCKFVYEALSYLFPFKHLFLKNVDSNSLYGRPGLYIFHSFLEDVIPRKNI